MPASDTENLLNIPGRQALVRTLDHRLATMLPDEGGRLQRAAAAAVRRGGKRLRPLLVLAAADGQNLDVAIQAAAAVELLHLGTIVHDDIIDNSDLRWGAPTVSHAEGPARALLVGDYLLAASQAQAAMVGPQVARVLAETLAVMCEGQDEEAVSSFRAGRTVNSYLTASGKKTAALMAAACRIGGLCAGLPRNQQEALDAFGTAFGMAFQLMDDLLDVMSTTEALGKPAGHDLGQGVYTLPVLYGLDGPAAGKVRSWLGRESEVPAPDVVAQTLREDGSANRVLDDIHRYNEAAVQALVPLGTLAAADGLAALPGAYLTWASNKLVY